MLVVDWVAPHGAWDDSLMFIFDGGVLEDRQLATLRPMDDELLACRFYPLRAARDLLRLYVYNRLRQAVLAADAPAPRIPTKRGQVSGAVINRIRSGSPARHRRPRGGRAPQARGSAHPAPAEIEGTDSLTETLYASHLNRLARRAARLPDARYQGAYAELYIQALALAAGMNALSYVVDDGIDIMIRHTADNESDSPLLRSWPGVDLQVKSWSTPSAAGEFWAFDRLNEKQFNKLACTDCTFPRYLVVIVVPPDRSRLTGLADDGLLLRHHAYYTQVPGPLVANPDANRRKRVLVPKRNVLTTATLRGLVHPELVAPRSAP
ncbi:DUF4365 domain-containing protein [Micromonospora sp. NPDC000442]|uniref:DUF4365 domain-containing protein n=1 Tax=Micromonospora sp. NPDC000442 TaxID=3364217 RepID=UPI00369DAD70